MAQTAYGPTCSHLHDCELNLLLPFETPPDPRTADGTAIVKRAAMLVQSIRSALRAARGPASSRLIEWHRTWHALYGAAASTLAEAEECNAAGLAEDDCSCGRWEPLVVAAAALVGDINRCPGCGRYFLSATVPPIPGWF